MAKKGKEKNQSVGDALSLGGVRVGVGGHLAFVLAHMQVVGDGNHKWNC